MSRVRPVPTVALAGVRLSVSSAGSSGVGEASTGSRPAATTASSSQPSPGAPRATPTAAGLDRYIGQQWRFASSSEEDAAFFVMQPGGALTWFVYLPGALDWDHYDDFTWATDGSEVTLVVKDVSTLTGTLADGNLTGTFVGTEGEKYTWAAEPASGKMCPR